MRVSILRMFVRRRIVSASLLAVLIVVSSLFLYAPHVGASTLVQRGYIVINGNTGFTAANGVIGGTGTSADPYIMSGWNVVSSSPNQVCIEIDNTTAFFTVENVSSDCPNYGGAAFASIAFELHGVSNGMIKSSYLGGNWESGEIVSSTNVTLSNNTLPGGAGSALAISGDVGVTLANNQIGGNVGVVHSQRVKLSGNRISGDPMCNSPDCGSGTTLYIDHSSTVTVSNNILNGAYIEGVLVGSYSLGLQIMNNSVHCNLCYSILLTATNDSLVQENRVSGGGVANGYSNWYQGIVLVGGSRNDQIIGNNVTLEAVGIRLSGVTVISVYHNSLLNNTIQASDDQPSLNSWDNGYPSGGNYWSDYKGVDRCGGPQQNICPFPDGIGDTPYGFSNSHDRYPLMSPFGFVNPPPLKVHASITITGNGGFTAANGVTGGSGTDSDPYMILGWNIVSDFGSIRISNATAFFVIRYVSVGNGFGGIIFNNVTNGRVVNSSVNMYCDGAISVSSSRNVVLAYNQAESGSGSPNECGGDGMDIVSSTNVVVADNSFPWSQGDALHIAGSNNVTVTGNSFSGSAFYALHLLGSSNTVVSDNSFSRGGLEIAGLSTAPNSYTITSDNLVIGKPLYYYDGCGPSLTLDGVSVGELILVNCSNVRLSNLVIHGTEVGITLVGVHNVLVENVNASQNHYQGLDVSSSSYVTVENSDFSSTGPNYFDRGAEYGMILSGSNNTIVDGSRFYNEDGSLEVVSSTNATITGNSFNPNFITIYATGSTGVHIFHNNFFGTENTIQPGQVWDNGYPSGGNYWSAYTGVDNCSGPQQNICPSPDGIGDTPYSIPGGVYHDHYPLMKPFVASSDPSISINQTSSFQGVTVTVTGSLQVSSGIVSGTVSLTATNSTSGAVLFSKAYIVTNLQISNNRTRFLLNVAVSPYSLSADVTLSLKNGVWSASMMVTRQLDMAGRGTVDIVDFGVVVATFDRSIGSPLYDPAANVTGSGTVNINDVGIMSAFFGAPNYT